MGAPGVCVPGRNSLIKKLRERLDKNGTMKENNINGY